MKKLLSVLLAMLLLGGTAFAEAEDYTGSWMLTGAEIGGMQLDAAALGLEGAMTLNPDGTLAMVTNGEEETGTWTLENGAIVATDPAGDVLTFVPGDGTLSTERDGIKAIYSRWEDRSAYVGTWILTAVGAAGMTVAPEQVGVDAYMNLYEDGTCDAHANGVDEAGTWAITETGITTTGGGTTDVYTYTDGLLVLEQEGLQLMFTHYVPLFNLTTADFNGVWQYTYAEIYDYEAGSSEYVDAEEEGISMTLTLQDGEGKLEIVSAEGTEAYLGECVVEEIEDWGSVLYFLGLDETGAQDGSGLMLLMYPGDELVWFEYDEETNVEIYNNFVRAQ